LKEDFDEDEALKRLRALSTRSIGEALLVQRVAAGIGNVYKSEVLFLEGVDPRSNVSSIYDDKLRALLRRASILLRRNVGDGPRTTRPTLGARGRAAVASTRAQMRSVRVWVYGRLGRPCLRCKTPVIMFRQGMAPGRTTYACTRCQGIMSS
jgi:endonuclease-8